MSKLLLTLILSFKVFASLAQTCDYTITGAMTITINSGELGCMTGNFSGSVSVQPGGELKMCGSYDNSGAISVNGTGKVTLTAGTSVSITGSMTFNNSNQLFYEGDASCTAELYNSGGSANVLMPAAGPLTNSSNIYMDGFFFQWGAATIGSGNHGRAPSPLCGSIASCTPMPIQLVKFKAVHLEDEVILEWATSAEYNNDYFTIERSTNGHDWNALIYSPGAGFSTELIQYFATDFEPIQPGGYYRLKQTDYDGSNTYSKVIFIKSEFFDPKFSVHPNPTKGKIMVNFSEGYLPNSVEVISLDGQKVVFIKNPSTEISMDLSELPKGVYSLKIQYETGVAMERIIVE